MFFFLQFPLVNRLFLCDHISLLVEIQTFSLRRLKSTFTSVPFDSTSLAKQDWVRVPLCRPQSPVITPFAASHLLPYRLKYCFVLSIPHYICNPWHEIGIQKIFVELIILCLPLVLSELVSQDSERPFACLLPASLEGNYHVWSVLSHSSDWIQLLFTRDCIPGAKQTAPQSLPCTGDKKCRLDR